MDDVQHSPLVPDWDDIPERDDAEPEDAESDHAGEVDVEEDEQE